MIVLCPGCKARLRLPDEKIKPGSVRIRCVKCSTVFTHDSAQDRKPTVTPARTVRTPANLAGADSPARPAPAPVQKSGRVNNVPTSASAPQARPDPAPAEEDPQPNDENDAEAGGPSPEDIAKAQEAYRRYGFMAEGPERMEQLPFMETLPGAFSFPLKGGGPLMLGIGAVFITVTLFFSHFAFLVGILGYVFVGGFLSSFMMRIVSQTADGETDFPDWPDFSDWWDDILGPIFQMIAVALVSYFPVILYLVLARPSDGPSFLTAGGLVFLGALYQPMALIAMSIFRSAKALSPLHILPAISMVPLDYAIACGGLLLIFVVKAVFAWVSFIPVVGTLLGNLVMLYLLTVEMRLLGLLYYSNRGKLNWI